MRNNYFQSFWLLKQVSTLYTAGSNAAYNISGQ